MNSRIKKIRKSLDLTQQEFADRLGIKRNTVATYEVGKSNPSDAAISLICREFNVNEEWLRTGVGEMFSPRPTNTLELFVKEHGVSKSEFVLMEKFLSLKPENRQAVMDYLLEVASALSGTTIPRDDLDARNVPETPADEYNAAADIDIEKEVAKYRAELELQKKAREKSPASLGIAGTGEKMA